MDLVLLVCTGAAEAIQLLERGLEGNAVRRSVVDEALWWGGVRMGWESIGGDLGGGRVNVAASAPPMLYRQVVRVKK